MEKIQIYLNSKRANKYLNDTADCIFHLPIINIKKADSVAIMVLHAQIPYSFYNVNETNDRLVYKINGDIHTIYFLHSNYNINNLKEHISGLLGPNFTISYFSASNKLTFRNSVDEFEFVDSSTCFELIGMSDKNHHSEGRILISDIVINLFTVRNLHIASNNFILNNVDSYNPNKSNILSSIPISSNYNGIISYSNIHDVSSEINSAINLTHLHIMITNQDGDIVNLNGAHWSITLLITIK